ncbi:flagellar hook-associated protein FlgL [Actimicrobium sp. CCC2.4]|uniref:flagellar hook-associated protein FlgL n=1 Tax=Actimicrobium sp. CCC2.4 TaxID=3048606 RepID=UPI002AC95564|nr:flagellar hook-associated protein FlgL [Actimicrobium sp. CCC2.4]MEB0135241.1 flagellar hook-associated protein FlgL [Actimicrobium sp. CCC2.4]WPX31035.1 flagellar hook-associated protein FlgL [Actimicrobium sp. CCC2.4]
MRISTAAFYDNASTRISDLQSAAAQKQTQIASGKRILTPADDPVAAAAALTVSQAIDVNTQFAANRGTAKDALSLQESVLSNYTTLLQNVKTLTIAAGNGALDDSQRQYMASELAGRYQELMGIANSRDSTGNYIFGGFKNTVAPFTDVAGTTATYNGDQGQRLLQVSTSRQLSINDAGSAIFQNIKSGDDSVSVTPDAGNSATGAGAISGATVTDATLLTHHNYSIDFTTTAGVTSYKVYDLSKDPGKASAPLTSANYTTNPQTIAFDGLQFTASGAPASGNKYNINPNAQSIFKTIGDLVTALNTPATGATGKAALTASLSAANNNITAALDTALNVRAAGGARLQELDTLDNEGDNRSLQYASTLSNLQDLDYAKAVSELTQNQLTLQAAQQSFVKIANLSLFNYIN